jgi:hypothetical protein
MLCGSGQVGVCVVGQDWRGGLLVDEKVVDPPVDRAASPGSTIDLRRETVDGLSRRISCIHRT